jgi:hypothetical protein
VRLGHERINQKEKRLPQARLYKKNGDKSRLAFLGHALMENRNGLIVDVEIRSTEAPGGPVSVHIRNTVEFHLTSKQIDKTLRNK